MTDKASPDPKSQSTPADAAAQSEPQTVAPPPDTATASSPATQPDSLQTFTLLMDDWLARHRKPPATLYHYTNAQGLHGMLATGQVWGTNVGFLNDPSEMRYAARLIRSVMAEEAKLKVGQQPAKETKDWFRKMAAKYADSISTNLTTWTESLLKTFEDQGDAYMTCFCTKGDLLSQWRGYGATGGGYALGFNARQIGTANAAAGGVLLRRVIYKPKEQQEIVRPWVRAFFKLGQSLAEAMREQLPDESDAVSSVFRLILDGPTIMTGLMKRSVTNQQLLEQGQQVFTKFLAECLICFKDPAYAEEQEWRVIQFGQNVPEIKFRPSGPRVVPYVQLALTPTADGAAAVQLPLKSITYGPTLEPAVTEKSLAMLLKHHKYMQTPIEIKRSGIPFRA